MADDEALSEDLETQLKAWLLEQIYEEEQWAVRPRKLVDCGAKRQIIALGHCGAAIGEGLACSTYLTTLQYLALRYADKEGYLEEWNPDPKDGGQLMALTRKTRRE